ncbi:hypothetical protein PILCRDRAFT_3448 [Piloderma croceum F 1598]|uniref:Chromo domain-containing protein n=1 Tax=Piloderma croceum (strain F 1598) TaxID=765440 RepID=A0A0C3BPN3_PILCF|nr:hypothetical protein PILCRDRAFT_3448 [Piloderma croceum F 1598]
MDSQLSHNCIQYLVKWKGYPERHKWTWEPLRNLTHADQAVDDFHKSHPASPQQINMNNFRFVPIPENDTTQSTTEQWMDGKSNLERSSSPLYTAPNTLSSSKRNSEDLEKNPMDSEAKNCVSRLDSGLSEAREQARVQQNTLNHILQLLQQLPITGGMQAPQDPPAVAAAPMVPALPVPTAALTAPVLCEPSCRLKLATPNDFDGDHLKG